MKTVIALAISTSCLLIAFGESLAGEVTARHPYKLTTYMGNEGSGISVSSVVTDPTTVTTNTVSSDSGTTPGNEYKLRWVFSHRFGQKDVFRFTYSYSTAITNSGGVTQSKEIQFDGSRVVVFKDALRTIVMTTPTAADIKQAAVAPAKEAAK